MKEFVGVKAILPTETHNLSLKQDALMFSRIAIPLCKHTLQFLREEETENSVYSADEIEWLLERDIVFEPKQDFLAKNLNNRDDFRSYVLIQALQSLEMVRYFIENDFMKFKSSPKSPSKEEVLALFKNEVIEGLKRELGKEKARAVKQISPENDADLEESLRVITEYHTRAVSIQLRELADMDAYPIVTMPIHSLQSTQAYKNDLVQIVLHSLPVPDNSVSWEQILDYRSDPDSTSKFLALRNWMNEVARAKLTASEVEEKLEYLINQFQQHMNIHRLKANTGVLETIVVTGAEFLEDLAKFKWGKLAKSLFSFKHRRIALMEGELKAPGSEIAYIVKAKEAFK